MIFTTYVPTYLRSYLTLDFCWSNFKTVSPLRSPPGGPVFKAGSNLIWGVDLGPITPQIARSPGRGALISMGMPGEALSKEYRCPLALISRVLDFPLKQFSEEMFFCCNFFNNLVSAFDANDFLTISWCQENIRVL